MTEESTSRTDRWTRILAISGILIAALSLCLSYVSQSSSQASRDEERAARNQERLDKVRDRQSAQLNRIMKLLTEYRSLSYVYFIQTAIARIHDEEADQNTGHSEHHRIEAEVDSELMTIPYFWRECVRKRTVELQKYLEDYQWEQILQSEGFVSKLSPDSDVTSMISVAIFIEQYDYRFARLREAMVAELAALEKSPDAKDINTCRDVAAEVEIEVPKRTFKTKEIVRLTPKEISAEEYRRFHWWGDDDLESYDREIRVRFHTPGKKTINLEATFFPDLGEETKATATAVTQVEVTVE